MCVVCGVYPLVLLFVGGRLGGRDSGMETGECILIRLSVGLDVRFNSPKPGIESVLIA